MCPLKVYLVKQSFSKRQKEIPHSPILLRIDWKVPLNRRILAPGWAGPLRQFSQKLEGCSGHWRQMEPERTNSCDRSGNGWCICPPLWGENHRWKELIKANKKKIPAGRVENFTSVFSFLLRRNIAITLGGIWTLESSQDLETDSITSVCGRDLKPIY